MAATAIVGIRHRHRITGRCSAALKRYVEQMRADVALEILYQRIRAVRLGSRRIASRPAARGLCAVTINALGAPAHGCAGLCGHMRDHFHGYMARGAKTVIRGTGKLVFVRSRSVRIMTACARLERITVPVLLRLDEIRILLMVRLGMLVVSPEIARGDRCVMTARVLSQEVRSAGSRNHHLVLLVERRILLDVERIITLGPAVALGADVARALGRDVRRRHDKLARAACINMLGTGAVAGFAANIHLLRCPGHRMHLRVHVQNRLSYILGPAASGNHGNGVAIVVARRALDVKAV